jgi:hypothetical protein
MLSIHCFTFVKSTTRPAAISASASAILAASQAMPRPRATSAARPAVLSLSVFSSSIAATLSCRPAAASTLPNRQEFFGSFFQKKTRFLP